MLGPRRNPIVVRPARASSNKDDVPSKEKDGEKGKESKKQSASGGKRTRKSRSRSRGSSSGASRQREPEKAKKQKAYAWMDSEEESGGSGNSGGSRKKKAAPKASKEEQEPRDNRPLLVKLGEVRTFSDMVRISPTLQQRASRLQPAEVSAAVAAAGRVKFYDADVFQSGLLPSAKRHLNKKEESFSIDEVVELVHGLAEMNVYDKEIFSKVVDIFVAKKESLEESGRRHKLLAAFRKVKHTSDSDFIEYLMRREKDELYQQRLLETQGANGPQIYYGGLRK
mmetsp:Transcript_24837/g.45583  ORF Transcript_24837/g.45583 Transcript_24837/m.45583 type:complete len:282 (-) Transcript_24837:35-880(-)